MREERKQKELSLLTLDYFLIDRVREVLNQGIDDHAKANLLCDIVKDEVERLISNVIDRRNDEIYEEGYAEGYDEGYDEGLEELDEESYREVYDEGFSEGVVAGIDRVLNQSDLNLTDEQVEELEYLLFKARREKNESN